MPDLQEWLPKHHRTESPFACCLPSCFSHGQLFVTLWTVAHQALLSIGFSRQEYWIGLLCPPPRNLLNPRIEPTSLTSPAFAGGLSRSNQSILKEISPGCSLEGMMLKLKLHYFGHLMQRVDLLEKTLMLGGIGSRRRRGRQRMRWLDGHRRLNGREFEWTPGVGDGQGGLASCNSWGPKESNMTGWLNWTLYHWCHLESPIGPKL